MVVDTDLLDLPRNDPSDWYFEGDNPCVVCGTDNVWVASWWDDVCCIGSRKFCRNCGEDSLH